MNIGCSPGSPQEMLALFRGGAAEWPPRRRFPEVRLATVTRRWSFPKTRADAGLGMEIEPADPAEWANVLQQRSRQQAEAMAEAQNRAEERARLEQALEDTELWRSRAEAAEAQLKEMAPLAAASCAACEDMLSRLAQATSLADLSDLSRKAYEVRTTMLSIEERARATIDNISRNTTKAQAAHSPSRKGGERPQHSRSPSPSKQLARPPAKAGRRAVVGGGGTQPQQPQQQRQQQQQQRQQQQQQRQQQRQQ